MTKRENRNSSKILNVLKISRSWKESIKPDLTTDDLQGQIEDLSFLKALTVEL